MMSTRKRLRPEDWDDIEPSPVVHLRGLSEHTLELDLIEAFEPYGPVKEVSIMPDRGQALIEFMSQEYAEAAVLAATRDPHSVVNCAKVNFSKSKRIIRRAGVDENGRSEYADFDDSHVLIITVYNARYPITTSVIHQIASLHGHVLRIVILRRALTKAMVEFGSIEHARNVKKHINGADIYSKCCSLKVDFAKPTRLRVTQNNDDTWDYENPVLNDGRLQNDRANTSLLGQYDANNRRQEGRRSRHSNGDHQEMSASSSSSIPPTAAAAAAAAAAGLPYELANTFLNRLITGQQPSDHHQSSSVVAAASAAGLPVEAIAAYSAGGGGHTSGGGASSSVIMVYNMDMSKMNCDRLFNLLCLYGNVVRIKFLRSKEGSAMAQMGDTFSVVRVIQNLSGLLLMNQQLSIRPSKQQLILEVPEPYNLPDGSPSYQDYMRSRNNRFVSAAKANKNRIYPPSSTLHYWNCPPEYSTDDVCSIFERVGASRPIKIAAFPQTSERSSSGLVEWPDQSESVIALTLANHFPVDSPSSRFPYLLKLSFSNTPVMESRRSRPNQQHQHRSDAGDYDPHDNGGDDHHQDRRLSRR